MKNNNIAEFLEKSLGEKWLKTTLIVVIVNVAVIILVVGLNYNRIKYSPATFVQEVIRTVITSTVIYLIVEFQRFKSSKNHDVYNFKNYLDFQILKPLIMVKELLVKARIDVESREFLKSIWSIFYDKLKRLDLYSFNISFSDDSIYYYKEIYKIDSLNGFIDSLNDQSFINTPALFTENEELLENLHKAFQNIKLSLQQ